MLIDFLLDEAAAAGGRLKVEGGPLIFGAAPPEVAHGIGAGPGPGVPVGALTESSFGALTGSSFGALTESSFGALTESSFGALTESSFGALTESNFGALTESSFGALTESEQSAFHFGEEWLPGQLAQLGQCLGN